MGLYKLIGRISIIALIFFSLQGEVIARLSEAFGYKADHTSAFARNQQARQRLVKLQCFTQKLQVQALPMDVCLFEQQLVRLVTIVSYTGYHCPEYCSFARNISTSRGPPSLS